MFRASAMGEVQGRGGAKLVSNWVKKRRGHHLKNDFGQSLASGFKEGAAKFGLNIVGEHEYSMPDRQFGALIEGERAKARSYLCKWLFF